MGNIKQINIKNKTYYFHNDIINIKDFDPSLMKIDNKSYKNIFIYNIGYIKYTNIQLHYRVLGYEIDLCFHDYKLAVEIDEFNHENRDIVCEIERQKAL